MKSKLSIILSLLAVWIFTIAGSCEPDPIDDPTAGGKLAEEIIGTWYVRYGNWWYEISFNSDNTGSYTSENQRFNKGYIGSFAWKINKNDIICKGVISHYDEDNEDVEVDELDKTYRLNENGYLYQIKAPEILYKKLGKDYPEDDDDRDDNSSIGGDDNNDNDDDTPPVEEKKEYIPYFVVEKGDIQGHFNDYSLYFTIHMGGANMPGSGLEEIGYQIECLSGETPFREFKRYANVEDDQNRYWTYKEGIEGPQSMPLRARITHIWRFKDESTWHSGQSFEVSDTYSTDRDISFIEDVDKPIQPGTSGTHNGHAWIDLGLSVKWATCNLGASSPEQSGDNYLWGYTTPGGTYLDFDYPCYNYNICGTENDAATVQWGDGWRMPTRREIEELISITDEIKSSWFIEGITDRYWTTINGVKCAKLQGSTGQTFYIPVNTTILAGESEDNPDYPKNARCIWTFNFHGDVFGWRPVLCQLFDDKSYIRPVCDR